ncbi:MAG: hypothetical protein K2X09_01910, partial [Rickettsiales bacterium]|nr:hypothetical protein [Rickettsiales bacterium]
TASIMIGHMRETLPLLTPSALDKHLQRTQLSVNAHMIDLHMLYAGLMMQTSNVEIMPEMTPTDELIRLSVEESHYEKPLSSIRYQSASHASQGVYGDRRMLQRALAVLMMAMVHEAQSSDVVTASSQDGFISLTLYDHPDMKREDDFVEITTATNLTALSAVTRKRLIALSYAMQVAHAHQGRLELMLWPDDLLAVRFVLPNQRAQ